MLLLVDVEVFPSELFNSEAIRAARTSGLRDSQISATDFGTTVDASPRVDLLQIKR